MNEEPILGWHFCQSDRRLGNGDGREIIVGEMLHVEPPLIMCMHGLHSCERAIDALKFARGDTICRVESSGEIIRHRHKLVAEARRTLWIADATRSLHEFACDAAERFLRNERADGREPHAKEWQIIAAKRLWLSGDIDDDTMNSIRVDAALIGFAPQPGTSEDKASWYDWHAAHPLGFYAWHAAHPLAWIAAKLVADRGEWEEDFEARMLALAPTGA